MRKFVSIILGLITTLFFAGIVSASIPNNSHPTTFLGPILKGSYTNTYNNTTAYSVLGEAGVQNFRLGGTVGFVVQNNQRLKVSAEYLFQKITYPFFVGNTSQWVNQGAVGAAYQYDFDAGWWIVPQFNLSAFYSHAPSKSLGTETGVFTNRLGVQQNFVDMRRIAGSNAAGIAPGVGFSLWQGSEAGLDLNYDSVRYDKRYSPNEDAIGFGGTARFTQMMTNSISLGLLAAVRKPFNNYQADIGWNMQGVIFDVMGAYTAGKNTLPSTWNVGVSADYVLDQMPTPTMQRQLAKNFVAKFPTAQLTQWVATPAVYLPQVLAIPDEKVSFSNVCQAPLVVGILGNLNPVTSVTTVPTAQVFSGQGPLTFSVAFTSDNPTSSTVVINQAGFVRITPFIGGTDVLLTITVTATNVCGSASTTFTAFIPGD